MSEVKGRPRFVEGGWVLIAAALLLLTVMFWALAPALLRMVERGPGDGINPSTYGVNIEQPRLPQTAAIATAMLHRDMVPVLDAPPAILNGKEVAQAVDTRDQYLVSSDAVIGVSINGDHRAYPIRILHIHEVIHDTLGDIPIAVTWHWPSASPRVFDRRLNGDPLMLGVSGLVAGGTQLLYPRNTTTDATAPPLVSQWTGEFVTGPSATLERVPFHLMDWAHWLSTHPTTSVVGEVPGLEKRYDKGDPNAYYRSTGLLFDQPDPPASHAPKDPVAVVSAGDETRLITPESIAKAGGVESVTVGGHPVIARLAQRPPRIEIEAPTAVQVQQGLWHAAAHWESD